jgi:hypothetical protein
MVLKELEVKYSKHLSYGIRLASAFGWGSSLFKLSKERGYLGDNLDIVDIILIEGVNSRRKWRACRRLPEWGI